MTTTHLPAPPENATVLGVYVRDGAIVGYSPAWPNYGTVHFLPTVGEESGEYLPDYHPEARRLAAETPVGRHGTPLAAWFERTVGHLDRSAWQAWVMAWRPRAGLCPCCGRAPRVPDLTGCTGYFRCPACGDHQHRRAWDATDVM